MTRSDIFAVLLTVAGAIALVASITVAAGRVGLAGTLGALALLLGLFVDWERWM